MDKTSLISSTLDRPLTDLYDTEGDGGFPGINFMARPVVGGHFAFLALERACGGQAVAGLKFLDEEANMLEIDMAKALAADVADSQVSSTAEMAGSTEGVGEL
jgi:hypothetical protein